MNSKTKHKKPSNVSIDYTQPDQTYFWTIHEFEQEYIQ
jgi:hypothetical protein